MIEGIIYCYHSPSNKYYIGQTIHESKRKRQHIQLSNTGDLEEANTVVKSVDFIQGYGWTVTFE